MDASGSAVAKVERANSRGVEEEVAKETEEKVRPLEETSGTLAMVVLLVSHVTC